MKKNDVKVGDVYNCKISGNVVPVRIDGENPRGGWDGTNLKTKKSVRIRSAQRLQDKAATWPGKRITGEAEHEQASAQRAAQQVRKDIAKTVQAVKKGDLAKGVAVPTGVKRAAKSAKNAKATSKRDTCERAATGGDSGAKPMSLLNAAAHLLSLGAGDPMRCQDIVDLAASRGLWTPRTGKTPANTLYAAILREIRIKGDGARFVKAERGKFTLKDSRYISEQAANAARRT